MLGLTDLQFLEYKAQCDAELHPVVTTVPPAMSSKAPGPTKNDLIPGPDDFMDQFIKKRAIPSMSAATQVIDPLEEFDRYFSRPCVDRSVCTDLVVWWGVSFLSSHLTFSIS